VTAIDDAAAAAARGELIVFPTDTVYGVGTRPDDPAATRRLFDAKGRPPELTLPVLVPSFAAARAIASFDGRAERLATAAWPGPLTLVLPRTDESRGWHLGRDVDTIGVRVPRHQLAGALLALTGPLATSSANRSGEPPARTCGELEATFGDRVAIYLCQEEPLEGLASTVVEVTAGGVRVLRAGTLDPSDLERLLGAEDPLLDSPPSGLPERG
jgi:L-threonylcarbamoyladenylate synthase